MNKKFSTLVGGLALLGSLTAGAFTPEHVDFMKATAVSKLPVSGNTLYQLGNETLDGTFKDSVVYMSDKGVLQFVPTPTDIDSLSNTMWCVTIADEQQGQNPKFNFLNKGTGRRLDITMTGLEGLEEETLSKDSLIAGGEIFGWAFSSVYKNDLEGEKPLYSRFGTTGDSIVGLGTKPGGNGLYAVKTAANKVNEALAKGLFVEFTIRTAAEIVLNATQINEKLGLQKADAGVNLAFSPEVTKNNPFNNKDSKFFAQQVTTASAKADSDSLKYVYVVKPDSTFLRVDTSYANTTGHGYLAYKWTDLSKDKLKKATSAVDSLNRSAWKAQHQFLFTYKPSEDSVKIYVGRAIFLRDGKKDWKASTDTVGFANARVFAQDLGSEMVLTVDSAKQNVKISLGYTGCGEVTSEKRSVPSGLYIIKNAKDEVLAAPIHSNGSDVQWVKLDAQMPEHMPAYQWVITQNQDALPKSSTLQIINREFADEITVSSAQLVEKDGKIVADDALSISFPQLKGVALTFTQITDSAIIKDERLGYKYVKDADLDVTKFKMNYLHAFNHNKWIGKTANDSVLYAQDDFLPFTMKAGRDSVYGVDVTAALLKKIPGLAQLKRSHYIVFSGAASLTEAADNKYAVGAPAEADTFYFKENNHYDGKHFYAIVENNGYCQIGDAVNKVGVADDGVTTPLKVQELTETRTSAFTVEEIDAPLYRRFAYDAPGMIEGRDTMRFIEQYRGEMLQLERNPNFVTKGIDFLGIDDEAKAKTGLSFIVDTAWVKRKLGYIKPQYLISIERDDIKGTPFQRCPECQALIAAGKEPVKDCKHDIQATPDMNFGKYLVNFADSVLMSKTTTGTFNKLAYDWKKYDRAGFVKAIQYGDSLYILKGEFASVTKKDMNLDLLKKIIEANKAKLKKDPNALDAYIINLEGDNHKYATWSMRFVKPGTSDKTFLIESMRGDDKDIAPVNAAWLRMQNGCLVLSDKTSSTLTTATNGDDALIFDVKRVAKDPIVTENESIATSSVVVIAGEGSVTINGAAGKMAVISNVLGQTLSTSVLTSDNATIAVPQGAVIVAVEGEAAVKAMVK